MRPATLARWSVFPALAVLTCGLHGQPQNEEERKRIAALVDRLANPRYADRVAAGRELEALGEKALPAVRKAEVEDADLERRTRARAVARIIMRAHAKSKSSGIEMVVVDEIAYDMGSPEHEYERKAEERPHRVRLTKPYWLGQHEVTQAQFEKVMGFNPSWFDDDAEGNVKVKDLDESTFPVERVTWFDAIEFCNRLGKLDGYPPHYKLEDVKLDGKSIVAAKVTTLGGTGYRLPTEAEWEAGCRGWSADRFWFGHDTSGREINCRPGPSTGYGGGPNWTALDRPAVVGNYKANHRGLHEMHGNVAEWCDDWYDRGYYAKSPINDPPGGEAATHKSVRGGAWYLTSSGCRSASRSLMTPGDRNYATGFRIARSP